MRTMTVGGAAPPRAMIEAFGERHGLHITHGWGMTEMCPIGTISGAPGQETGLAPEEAYDKRALQGPPIPVRRDPSPRRRGPRPVGRRDDGRARGAWPLDRLRLLRRARERATAGRTTAGSAPETSSRSSPTAYVEIQDRSKDLVKSGGEWISTVALENALMGHPAILEAAVIAVPDEKWSERPLAVVVFRDGQSADADELRAFLAPDFAKWWLPDRFEAVDEIPKTAVGKFRKTALRERFS